MLGESKRLLEIHNIESEFKRIGILDNVDSWIRLFYKMKNGNKSLVQAMNSMNAERQLILKALSRVSGKPLSLKYVDFCSDLCRALAAIRAGNLMDAALDVQMGRRRLATLRSSFEKDRALILLEALRKTLAFHRINREGTK